MMSNTSKVIIYYLQEIQKGKCKVLDGKLVRTKRNKELGHITKQGYIRLSHDNQKAFLHRILYAFYHGFTSLDNELTINHIDGNKHNNRKENLELITRSENAKHQWKNGLGRVTSKNYKLSIESVREIKSLLAEGQKPAQIANIYNVNKGTIQKIKRGILWRGVV